MTPEQEELLRQILSQLRSISTATVLLVIIAAGALALAWAGIL